ncbi:EamA family transporter [Gilliamella sp. WF3-4]|jgi:drug/metabolite transporter (DMT)-like permease|uniref:EamA family transporter n=1 Tax=Gilliamella sp. WF3-4 TaxID=3120255 RepID=UPI00080EC832|nr:hypothetical protein [Gilliamella apicola]OCG16952.1 hypothetical protein A9G47_09870 [Gilliamella apicola]
MFYSASAIFLYCLTTALGAVWISFAFTGLSGFTVTFFTLTIAFVIFSVIQKLKNKGKNIYWLSLLYPYRIFELNILTLFSWLFAFLALYNIEASIECALFQGALPLGVLLCELFSKKTKLLSLRVLGVSLITISLIILVVFRVRINQAAIDFTQQQIYLGAFLAFAGGISAGFYAYRSSGLYAKSRCSTMDILCNRFFLLILITGIIASQEIISIFSGEIELPFKLLILSLISVVIPVFALQYSIEKIGPARVSIITPTIPIIALAIEHFTAGWNSILIPASIGVTSLCLILANVWMKRK